VLILQGPTGSGKSCAARLLASILDPNIAPLCRFATGTAFFLQETPSEQPVPHEFRRPIILTVDEKFQAVPDLARRARVVKLAPIPSDLQLPESQMISLFAELHPYILAWLCDRARAKRRPKITARQVDSPEFTLAPMSPPRAPEPVGAARYHARRSGIRNGQRNTLHRDHGRIGVPIPAASPRRSWHTRACHAHGPCRSAVREFEPRPCISPFLRPK
jgi:hypothetical protein